MYRLIEYVTDSNLASMQKEEAACIDVVNIAFAQVVSDQVIWNHPECADAIARLRSWNPEMKILLSVGGWGAGGFSEAAFTPAGRQLFADSAVGLVERYGLDGIDVDWEYPCIDTAGIRANAADKVNFTLLLREVRQALEKKEKGRYMLTIAAGGDSYFINNTQMSQVAEYLDYVQIMTYDFRGCGGSLITGHHTNLYAAPQDLVNACVDRAVRLYMEAGIAPDKLFIGAAFYSRVWANVKNENHGMLQQAERTVDDVFTYGELVERYIGQNGYTRYWDEDAKAPWLFNGECFISYDDKESLGWKIDYLKEKGLAGIMCWEYGCDTSHTLTGFMRSRLDLEVKDGLEEM